MADDAPSSKQTGKVKWYHRIEGFGFITPDDGTEELFVHRTSIHADGFPSLRTGEPAEFVAASVYDGWTEATHVTGPQGAYVEGARPPPRTLRDASEWGRLEGLSGGNVGRGEVNGGRRREGQLPQTSFDADHEFPPLRGGRPVEFVAASGAYDGRTEAKDVRNPQDAFMAFVQGAPPPDVYKEKGRGLVVVKALVVVVKGLWDEEGAAASEAARVLHLEDQEVLDEAITDGISRDFCRALQAAAES